ncbi:PREDICTED: uncharacterized protein LOC109487668 [Branchiostoma belcheri]|uniref:Uncharacterized protein LOC109487668 n=1 Tax=Branchiostoma belcheri TaxID=7741 RepID=A0A6P5AC56_BRABE|nr:PREDICTED: uncharacterized protein LOC109487668 [Branchiostoma belcheri]
MHMAPASGVFVKTFLLWLAVEFGVASHVHQCAELCTSSAIPKPDTRFLCCTRRGRFEHLCNIKSPSIQSYTLYHGRYFNFKTLTASSLRQARRGSSQPMARFFIRKSAIERIETGAFTELPHLRFLSLTCNSLSFIARRSFEGLIHLTVLDLRRNYLPFLLPGAFANLESLTQLYLSHNELKVMPIITRGCQLALGEAMFLDLSHNHLTFMSSRELDRVSGAYLQLDQNPFRCDEGWDWFTRHMANSSRILCFKSVTCGPPPDLHASTTSLRVKILDVPDTKVSQAVLLEVAIPFAALLLLAFCCAIIKICLSKQAAMDPVAHPAPESGHSENDYEDGSRDSPVELKEMRGRRYADCSYDSSHHVSRTQRTAPVLAKAKFENRRNVDDSKRPQQPPSATTCAIVHDVPNTDNSGPQPAEDGTASPDREFHIYDNDMDLQDGLVAHQEDPDEENHEYDYCTNHEGTIQTLRLVSWKTTDDQESEVQDHNPAYPGGIRDGSLKEEPAGHDHNPTVQKAKEFTHPSEECTDGRSNQREEENPPPIPPKKAAMTADEGMSNEFGGANVCTYMAMRGNDLYEAAGTDNSREEPGGQRCLLFIEKESPETTLPPTSTSGNVDQSTTERVKILDVPGDTKVSQAVLLEVTIPFAALLVAFCCAVIKICLSKQAAMDPVARPAPESGHSENDYEDGSRDSPVELKEMRGRRYEDCSYDSSHHVRRTQRTAPVLAQVTPATDNRRSVDDSDQPPSATACAIVHDVPNTDNSGHQPAEDGTASPDREFHIYDNDVDLQDGLVAHQEEPNDQNHEYDYCTNDEATSPTRRLISWKTTDDQDSEVQDHNPAYPGGIRDDSLEEESAGHDHNPTVQKAKEFAHPSEECTDGRSNQREEENPPPIPPRMAATTGHEGISNGFGDENVCTYMDMRGNDLYEAAGTDNSREEPGDMYGTEAAQSSHGTPLQPPSSTRVGSADDLYGAGEVGFY